MAFGCWFSSCFCCFYSHWFMSELFCGTSGFKLRPHFGQPQILSNNIYETLNQEIFLVAKESGKV